MYADTHADPIHGYTDGVEQLRRDQAAERTLRAAIAADRAAEEAEWTTEVTTARRATWNGLVKAAAAKLAGKKMTAMQVASMEKQAGFTLATLKTHIARHGL